MRLARVGHPGREVPVVMQGGRAYDLRPITHDIDGNFLATGIEIAEAALSAGLLPILGDVSGERLGPPITRPGKIVCIGLNYRDHAAETGAAIPAEPVVFLKDPSTIVGPFETVLIPRSSAKTDWEVELGVVIGREARYLDSPEEALSCVAGYTVSHDVSEREFQLERGGQWDKGKSCETFNPLGPVLVTRDEILDPQNLSLRLSVNGTVRQSGNTSNMVFPVSHLIWYLSQFMVLRPGDLVNTGTPAGVALGLPGLPYLRGGDVVELEIESIGVTRQIMEQA